MQITPADGRRDRPPERRHAVRHRRPLRTRTSTSATAPTTCATCSTATTATRSPRSPPTTPAARHVDGWGGADARPGRDPVPGDARLRRGGARQAPGVPGQVRGRPGAPLTQVVRRLSDPAWSPGLLFPLRPRWRCAVGCGPAGRAAARRLRCPGAGPRSSASPSIVVVAQFLTAGRIATAERHGPGRGRAGASSGSPRAARKRRGWRPPWVCGARPRLASSRSTRRRSCSPGEATFAGYIRLDDTATWMALTDRVMDHGRSLGGPGAVDLRGDARLQPRRRATRSAAFLPLGIGSRAGRPGRGLADPALHGRRCAALLALALWHARRLARATRGAARAVAAFLAAQSALLFGYYLWGGIKEVAVAALLVRRRLGGARDRRRCASAALRSRFRGDRRRGADRRAERRRGDLAGSCPRWPRSRLARARGSGPRLQAPGRRGVRGRRRAPVLRPRPGVRRASCRRPPRRSPARRRSATCSDPLNALQLFGIWPAGDFRLDPVLPPASYALIAVALVAALDRARTSAWRAAGAGRCSSTSAGRCGRLRRHRRRSARHGWRARRWRSPPRAPVCSRRSARRLGLDRPRGAPRWGESRRLRPSRSSGGVAVVERARLPRRQPGAPRPARGARDDRRPDRRPGPDADDRVPALRRAPLPARRRRRRGPPSCGAGRCRCGRRHAAQGDDRRHRSRSGSAALLIYRTLVLRRSPAQSRPPSPYRLIWRGDYYEVWQRPAGTRGDR